MAQFHRKIYVKSPLDDQFKQHKNVILLKN